MVNAVIDFRASDDAVDALKKNGFNVIKTLPQKNVYNAICGHPDIMLHNFGDFAVAEPMHFEYFKEKIKNMPVIKGKTKISGKYPEDIAYNAVRIGKIIICSEDNTDPIILTEYRKMGYKIVNTKQGYAKCSTAVVSDNAIITSDRNIAAVAANNAIEVLQVGNGNIKLEDFDYGFIGGATGLYGDKLYINGNIKLHKDCDKIIRFCRKYGVEPVSLTYGDIYDIGSILFF